MSGKNNGKYKPMFDKCKWADTAKQTYIYFISNTESEFLAA